MSKWLPPKITTAERLVITPDIGEIIYDETVGQFYSGDGVTIGGAPIGGSVDSVFGRNGAVIPVSGDYTASQVTNSFDKTIDDTDDLSEGAINKFTTSLDIAKLAGISSGATANSTDAVLLDRANHTGTQTMSTISDAGALATLSTITLAEVTDSGALAALDTVGAAQIDTGAVGSDELSVTTVTAGSYDLASFTVDVDGRITAASNGSISMEAIELSNTTQTTLNSGVSDTFPNQVAWSATAVTDISGGTLTPSTSGVTVVNAGTYRIYASLAQSSVIVRSNIGIRFKIAGSETGPEGLSGYIRSSSGQNNSSVSICMIRTLSAGQAITVAAGQFGDVGTVTTTAGLSNLIVERIA